MNYLLTQEANLEPVFGLSNKLKSSLASAVLFIAVTPHIYSSIANKDHPKNDCSTPVGHLMSTAVFFVANYLMMKIALYYSNTGKKANDLLLVKYALCASLLYYVISSTDMYKITGQVGLTALGAVDDKGCPTIPGVVVHAVVFTVLLVLMMLLPKDE